MSGGTRSALAGALVAALWLCAPGSALAGSVVSEGGVLYYAANTGEMNKLTVSDGAMGTLMVTDTTAPVTVEAGCVQVDAHTAQCAFADTDVTVDLGDKDDSVTIAYSEQISSELRGAKGDDVINGGPGPDAINGGPGADKMHGGAGVDNILYTDANAGVSVTMDGVANDGTTGEGDNVAGDFENLYGGPHDDTLVGNHSANTLVGNGGADTMQGEGGNDVFFIDGADVIDGGKGFDSVDYYGTETWDVSLDGVANDGVSTDHANVHSGIELLQGGSGADTLIGDSKANYLLGMGGDDLLIGKSGSDSLNGGDGSDTCKGGGGSNTYTACETTS